MTLGFRSDSPYHQSTEPQQDQVQSNRPFGDELHIYTVEGSTDMP